MISKRKNRNSHLRGFTLLEVLVALAVMGITFSALSQISGVSAKASRSLALSMARSWNEEQSALFALNKIRSGDIENLPPNLSINLNPSPLFNDDEEEILKMAGWKIVNVSITSTDTSKLLWNGEILLTIEISDSIGGF